MAVVTASSHSRKMGSLESRPLTPQTLDEPGIGERDAAKWSSEIAESDGMFSNHTPTPIKPPRLTTGFSRKELRAAGSSSTPATDSAFVNKHLNLCPESALDLINNTANLALIAELKAATSEGSTYTPASELLTNISKAIWGRLTNNLIHLCY